MDPDFDLTGTAHLIHEIDKKLMVVLKDGRTFIGYLRSVDQFATLVFQSAVERIFVGKEYGEVPRGSFIVRGENIILLGELDPQKDSNLPLNKVSMEVILEASRKEQESKRQHKKLLRKSLQERGLSEDQFN